MPTRLGNLLRLARPDRRTLMASTPVQLWTRLWLLLSDAATREITATRSRLESAAVAWVWALLCGLWVFLAWWTLPLAIVRCMVLLSPASSFRVGTPTVPWWKRRSTCTTASCAEAARWPLPETPAAEFASGQALSRFLIYGYAEPEARYTSPWRIELRWRSVSRALSRTYRVARARRRRLRPSKQIAIREGGDFAVLAPYHQRP